MMFVLVSIELLAAETFTDAAHSSLIWCYNAHVLSPVLPADYSPSLQISTVVQRRLHGNSRSPRLFTDTPQLRGAGPFQRAFQRCFSSLEKAVLVDKTRIRF